MQGHAPGGIPPHRDAARPDHQIGRAGQHGAHEPTSLGRVVGAVRLQEDHGRSPAPLGLASAPQTRVPIAATLLVEHLSSRGGDQRRAAVPGTVVHEDRAVEQA